MRILIKDRENTISHFTVRANETIRIEDIYVQMPITISMTTDLGDEATDSDRKKELRDEGRRDMISDIMDKLVEMMGTDVIKEIVDEVVRAYEGREERWMDE